MKKLILYGYILLTAIFLLGCVSNAPGNIKAPVSPQITSDISPPSSPQGKTSSPGITLPVPEEGEAGKIQDYYPIRPNTRYFYEGVGNEFATYDVYVDYATKNALQQRVSNPGTVLARVIKIGEGKVVKGFTKEESYYRENFLDAKGGEEEILLMEPLRTGITWNLKDARVRTITGTSVNVNTPSGEYKAIEVLTQGPNDKTIDYYAPGVGLVQSIFISGDNKITSTLSQIQEDVPFTQSIRFFYPDSNVEKIVYVDKEVDFHTNDVTRKILETAYKDTPEGASRVFSPGTQINSLYLNADGMVYLDLNKAFITEMNAGSGYEQLILQSVADTFGTYYQTDKVLLTIDNKRYESGHIILKKGEYLKADPQNATTLE